MISEPLRVTIAVAEALERLGVPYLVGGSLASSAHGVARATLDADIVAELSPEQAARFVQELGPGFYVDIEAVADAAMRRSSFNVIHLETMFKVDIFIPKRTAYAEAEMARRQLHVIDGQTGARLVFSTAEDTLLSKLVWYREGQEVSERQWRDILGILAVCGERLDRGYLLRWAGELEVTDLLERALREAPRARD